MDLGAYIQIEDLEQLANINNIDVPRLRGYRLMSEETPIEIDSIITDMIREIYKQGCISIPSFCPDSAIHKFSAKTDYLRKKYLTSEGEFRWELLHGKRRKNMKFAVKKMKKAVLHQYETFNKYAGASNVLYIHARIGGSNWSFYQGYLLEKEPWFLEKVDDCFDDTYCDIYARLDKTISVSSNKELVK